jgi:putative hydrolase of the HAD superfamily
MPNPIIVFDLDDTLYAERDFAISGFRACERWLEETHGVGGIVEEMTRLLDAGHMRSLFEIVLEAKVPLKAKADIDAFIDVYRYHDPEIALYPDAQWALDHFCRSGPIGLITDGQHEVQSSKVRALEIAHHFQHIVYTGALGGRAYSKPHPLSYEQMEAALGGAGEDRRFVYVGDNPAKDFVTPNARGWISVQVHRPMRIHARAQTAPGGAAQHEIHSLEDLPGLLAVIVP